MSLELHSVHGDHAELAIPEPIVAFQGEFGAYSHEAIELRWRGRARPLPCGDFTVAVDAVASGWADYAMVPIDNNTIGKIHAACEALAREPRVRTVEHLVVPVQHCLVGVQGAVVGDVARVVSHPAALAQCSRFLAAHGFRGEEMFDTAGAAAHVARQRDASIAAIAPMGAAWRHGLVILAEGIQDREDNETTFVVVARV